MQTGPTYHSYSYLEAKPSNQTNCSIDYTGVTWGDRSSHGVVYHTHHPYSGEIYVVSTSRTVKREEGTMTTMQYKIAMQCRSNCNNNNAVHTECTCMHTPQCQATNAGEQDRRAEPSERVTVQNWYQQHLRYLETYTLQYWQPYIINKTHQKLLKFVLSA